MLKSIVWLLCCLMLVLGVAVVPLPDGPIAIILVIVLSALTIFILRRFTDQKEFITTVFVAGLAIRLGFGIFVHVFDLRDFFGGDALTYDYNASQWVDVWLGRAVPTDRLLYYNDPRSGAGWGMNYLIAGLYMVVGKHNIFAGQSFCAVIGAATGPLVFLCSRKIYENLKVARFAAVAIAIFPSFVIWSSQMLKDGLIIFLLVLAMTMVLQLQQKLNYPVIAMLAFALFGILSLRFYIFYMTAVAVAGSLVVGLSGAQRSFVRATIILVLLGVALTFLGVGRQVGTSLSIFANLDRIQSSRSDLASRATSGFGADVDVSTSEGALTIIPLGFAYLMFAPFPWQAVNLRQAITIPEVLLWWSLIPFLITGLIYTVKHRLRNAFPILLFSLLLTLAYSLFQGNVGTAYRQRTQIQVFLFIFIGVGWTLFWENRENKRLLRASAQKRAFDHLRRK